MASHAAGITVNAAGAGKENKMIQVALLGANLAQVTLLDVMIADMAFEGNVVLDRAAASKWSIKERHVHAKGFAIMGTPALDQRINDLALAAVVSYELEHPNAAVWAEHGRLEAAHLTAAEEVRRLSEQLKLAGLQEREAWNALATYRREHPEPSVLDPEPRHDDEEPLS